jgi:hypothetical protein
VERTSTNATLILNIGQCVARADNDSLVLRAEADNEPDLRRIQQLLTRDLERFGRREQLTVTWSQDG